MIKVTLTVHPKYITDGNRLYSFGPPDFYKQLGLKIEPAKVYNIDAIELESSSIHHEFDSPKDMHYYLHDKCPHGYAVTKIADDFYIVNIHDNN